MIILEEPYVSPEMGRHLAASGIPVLDNAVARSAPFSDGFTLLPDREFAHRVDAGAKLYTTSENALDWVVRNIRDESILSGIGLMKDKHRLRDVLRPMYPDFYYREAGFDELFRLDPATLPLPLVLKPAVGFFSVGVHVVATVADWRAALADIRAKHMRWRDAYPAAVVGGDRFLLEEYIEGEEYAIDAYYDADGQAVILNILKHDFASASDVRDRLYHTSLALLREHLDSFTGYLNRMGSILRLQNFPFHLELRLAGGKIVPIECNPMRFAGWCSTDIAWFAYGIRTYEYYLKNIDPRRSDAWSRRFADSETPSGTPPLREDDIFSMIILDKPNPAPADRRFDFSSARAAFTQVLHERPVDFPDSPVYGFLFTRTPANRRGELDRIMRSDLSEYLTPASS